MGRRFPRTRVSRRWPTPVKAAQSVVTRRIRQLTRLWHGPFYRVAWMEWILARPEDVVVRGGGAGDQPAGSGRA